MIYSIVPVLECMWTCWRKGGDFLWLKLSLGGTFTGWKTKFS